MSAPPFLGVRNARSGALLGDRIRPARGALSRMRGLLGRPEPKPGEGLLIAPCNGVHTFFMRYPIDVAFIATDGTVVGARAALPPFRAVPWVRGARQALELPQGTLERTRTRPGDMLVFIEPERSIA